MEAHIATFIGESLHELTERVSGKAIGKARHGTTADLALYTLEEDVRVMVITADRIFSTTPDEKLLECVAPAFVPGEREKSRVVCVILHKEHFDLGVIRTLDSVQAVFQVGQEWERVLLSLLSFVKSRSPHPGATRQDLGPRWVPPTSPEGKEASKKRKGELQVRAGNESVSVGNRIGVRKTRSSVLFVRDTTLHTTHQSPNK